MDYQYPTGTGPAGAAGPAGPIGITWRGVYSNATAYAVNDAVSFTDGASYICIAPTTGNAPPNASFWNLIASGGIIASRQTVTLVTGSLAPGQTENLTVALAKTFALSKIVSSDLARIRLYSTAAARTADASRPATISPTVGTQHGVILDLNMQNSPQDLTWILSPLAYGANDETVPSTAISYAITNNSVVTQALTITFTFTSEED